MKEKIRILIADDNNDFVNTLTTYFNSQEDVEKTFVGAVPDHLKNHNYMNEKRAKYKYPHNYGGYVEQQYLPDGLKDKIYYVPSDNGYEKKVKEIRKKKGIK